MKGYPQNAEKNQQMVAQLDQIVSGWLQVTCWLTITLVRICNSAPRKQWICNPLLGNLRNCLNLLEYQQIASHFVPSRWKIGTGSSRRTVRRFWVLRMRQIASRSCLAVAMTVAGCSVGWGEGWVKGYDLLLIITHPSPHPTPPMRYPSLRGGTTKQSVDNMRIMNFYFLSLMTLPVKDETYYVRFSFLPIRQLADLQHVIFYLKLK